MADNDDNVTPINTETKAGSKRNPPGYKQIEALKAEIAVLELRLSSKREAMVLAVIAGVVSGASVVLLQYLITAL